MNFSFLEKKYFLSDAILVEGYKVFVFPCVLFRYIFLWNDAVLFHNFLNLVLFILNTFIL